LLKKSSKQGRVFPSLPIIDAKQPKKPMSDINSIISKYLKGQTSEEENHQLYDWTHHTPENKKRLFGEKDIWDTLGFHSNLKGYEVNSELELVKSRITPRQPRSYIVGRQILKMAAMLLVTFGLGWASQFISFSGNQPTGPVVMQDIFVPRGQVNQVFLADGTRIWINSESHLIAPSVFTAKDRVVKLNGEAFFEVARDKKRPFRVEVNGQQIEVLGTSFNVRAYDNSNEIETTLTSGSVQLKIGSRIAQLKPGEQSVFDRKTSQLSFQMVDPVTFSSWKDGRYEFQNKNLIEVFKVIERWYDVEITADQTYFAGMHFSGVIKRNKDAKHFLELLNHSIPIKYEINLDKIKISRK
jgi:ferric-dicitrate binding protein FerR (iron transport regulator)